MRSSQEVMQEATQLFAKLGQNVTIRKNLEKEARELDEKISTLEAEYQAALKAEAEATPSDPSASASDAAPAPTADATGTP